MFLVLSEDLKWCRKELAPISKNVVVVEELASVEEDLALVSSGTHVIMSVGTYGFWGGFLAGGEIVYPASRLGGNPYSLQKTLNEIIDDHMIRIHW